jgi:hypothetical protein
MGLLPYSRQSQSVANLTYCKQAKALTELEREQLFISTHMAERKVEPR